MAERTKKEEIKKEPQNDQTAKDKACVLGYPQHLLTIERCKDRTEIALGRRGPSGGKSTWTGCVVCERTTNALAGYNFMEGQGENII